ncbi:protein MIS12 homolog isoform X3 [Dreissena polymorpha]|uniref:Protein MIS12 homolog n=1 Tax=Dreissena polymorpha TaxID=45954 RepID=A0A9D4FYI9_DREPO|nr:protein MIS12 homolog isoform X3 [Dreissena polymorpha]KAH3805466.1 hypothetical protein DPMN_133769 [Dreissena polymorpha]
MAENTKQTQPISGLDIGTEEGLSTTEDEYCVQYFGFHPQTFMNGMYNTMCGNLQDARTTLNDAILSTFRDTVSPTELEEVSFRQGQIAIDRLNTKFDKAELYLNTNVFNIPSNIVLPEDQVHTENPMSPGDMAALDQQIQTVTDKIIAVKYANSVLQDRLQEIESLQEQLNKTVTSVDKVYVTISQESVQCSQQMKSLQTLAELVEKCSVNI